MNLYCLEIVKAYPDYKRPYVSTNLYHFKDPYSANEKRREEKLNYYQNFIEYLEETEDKKIEDIDDLDEDEAQTDYIYSDSYMDMSPFTATLYEIYINDDIIKSKRISFPVTNKIEGNN